MCFACSALQLSTPRVAADTLALAEKENLKVALLPAWYDVDDVASLQRLRDELAAAPAHVAPRVLQRRARLTIRSIPL